MNLFKGLEKFGLKTEGTENLFEEEKRTNASTEQGEAKEEIPSEESFLLDKTKAKNTSKHNIKQKI